MKLIVEVTKETDPALIAKGANYYMRVTSPDIVEEFDADDPDADVLSAFHIENPGEGHLTLLYDFNGLFDICFF